MWRFRNTVVLLMAGWLGSGAVLATDVQVSGLFRGKALLIIDGQSRLMAEGESHGGVTLVEADSRRARVSVQGVEQELTMNQRIGGGYRASTQPSLQIWPDARGMYRTAGTINGFAVSFLIDTGATSIAMNSVTARRIGLDYRLRSELRRVSTASAVVDAYGLSLKRVTVGKLSAANIDAVVIEGQQPDEILLGMSFLGRMEISHQNGAMEIKQKY
ncbi:MAG: TIGR02281 family clan AA aspartic protease [Gammaproteobacteria bacterium]